MMVFATAVLLLAPISPAQSPDGPAKLAPESPRRPWIVLTIESVKATSSGYTVRVKVQNDGKAPVTLIARREESQSGGKPYLNLGLEVDQWDDKLGWQFVGPGCSDVPVRAVDAYTFRPGEVIRNILSVPVPPSKDLMLFCPTLRSAHAGAKVRAALYCAYENEQQFLDERMKPPPHIVPCRLESVSKPVRLPPRQAGRSKKSQ